jgi:oligoribonuclease NrnB/cAMP/cGMP phosphodiesterase (DHH superfamily)
MKVLLFTHKSDIDGMGNAVLAKLAFDEVKYILCETFNLQNEISKFYKDGSIYNYDFIFVTDLWLEEPTLSKVANDEKLKNKFFVFDHHESALKENFNKYSFTTIKISNEKGLCSGTSLFYEYLVSNGLILPDNKAIEDFSELTRKYDTWEWKEKYNDEMPHELTLLFDSVGCDGYIKLMYQKLMQDNYNEFSFNELERMLINNKINQVREKLSNYSKKVFYEEIFGLKAGIVFIDYEYRNDLAEYFRQNNFDMDFAMLVALDYGTISYRNIKDGINVRFIAESMGGKGHDKAASSPIDEIQKKEFIKILTEKKSK